MLQFVEKNPSKAEGGREARGGGQGRGAVSAAGASDSGTGAL